MKSAGLKCGSVAYLIERELFPRFLSCALHKRRNYKPNTIEYFTKFHDLYLIPWTRWTFSGFERVSKKKLFVCIDYLSLEARSSKEQQGCNRTLKGFKKVKSEKSRTVFSQALKGLYNCFSGIGGNTIAYNLTSRHIFLDSSRFLSKKAASISCSQILINISP